MGDALDPELERCSSRIFDREVDRYYSRLCSDHPLLQWLNDSASFNCGGARLETRGNGWTSTVPWTVEQLPVTLPSLPDELEQVWQRMFHHFMLRLFPPVSCAIADIAHRKWFIQSEDGVSIIRIDSPPDPTCVNLFSDSMILIAKSHARSLPFPPYKIHRVINEPSFPANSWVAIPHDAVRLHSMQGRLIGWDMDNASGPLLDSYYAFAWRPCVVVGGRWSQFEQLCATRPHQEECPTTVSYDVL